MANLDAQPEGPAASVASAPKRPHHLKPSPDARFHVEFLASATVEP